jgi:ATP-binding cassette subfamily F protein 3
LEQALNSYTGTVLYVSHDRYFINTTATRILDLTGETLVNYIGNYDYYLEKKDELTAIYAPKAAQTASSVKVETENKLDWKAQKEAQAQERKRQNDLKKVEARIAELEARDKEIDTEMEDPAVFTSMFKCQELSKEKDAILTELEELYEQWEMLAE